MEKNVKYILFLGITVGIGLPLLSFLILLGCSDGLQCIASAYTLLAFPGIILKKLGMSNVGTNLMIASFFIYFIIGGLVGYLLSRIKRRTINK